VTSALRVHVWPRDGYRRYVVLGTSVSSSRPKSFIFSVMPSAQAIELKEPSEAGPAASAARRARTGPGGSNRSRRDIRVSARRAARDTPDTICSRGNRHVGMCMDSRAVRKSEMRTESVAEKPVRGGG
jgi:hypothetical protein